MQVERKTTVFTTLKNVLAAIAAVTILGVPFHSSADGRKNDDDDHHKQKLLTCDDTLKSDFQPDSLTTVLLVKAFNKGEALTLSTPTPTTPVAANDVRSEEHTSELQSLAYLVCRLLLEKKKKHNDLGAHTTHIQHELIYSD